MPLDPEKSVLIMGTGAMACLFAARLSAAAIPVWMYGTWAEGIQALCQEGVRLTDASGKETTYPVQVVVNPKDCLGARYALVLVKSWQTKRAAHELSTCLAEDGVALTLQNGLGNRETLAEQLGEERVCLGVTTIGANMLGPGWVIQAGEGVISISAHPRISPLVNMLRSAGLTVEIGQDPTALLWGKLVINAAINPLTALLKLQNGELLERSHAKKLLWATVREAAAVANALGICLPYKDPAATAEAIAQRTAKNRSSMLQDILRGSPTEVDAICGVIVQSGEQAGVPTPIIHTLYLLVKSLQPEEK
jgi:2-dehydropantoate 2-reductase